MKKISKLLMLAVLALGVSFTACNNDVPEAEVPENLKGSSYASVAVAFPKAGSTRALPEDFNPNGEWKGVDAIQKITVFLVNQTVGTIDYTTFTEGSFLAIDANGVLKPNLALKATPGENVKAYVVVNDVNDVVTSTLKGAAVNQFASAFADETAALAANVATNNGTNDVVMMTNESAPSEMTIDPNVTEDDAKGGVNNYIKVDVERVVARAMVTIQTGLESAEIAVNDAQGNQKSTIKIEDVSYVVGQSNKKFYIMKQFSGTNPTWVTPDPVYAYVPASGDWSTSNAMFDYAGLGVPSAVQPIANIQNSTVSAALAAEKGASKFVLPVTHAAANYRKGNTTYFEVTAIFTPALVDGATYTPGNDVYLGLNDGLFYSTRELAEEDGQKAVKYKGDNTKGAIMKYVLWLNPDIIPGTGGTEKASMSPTVRNQVYHVHIKGFKHMGVPNNPLDPDDPNDDPDNPDNPIDPEDPLETEDTYLSVEITVLPWGLHTYEIDLGNNY